MKGQNWKKIGIRCLIASIAAIFCSALLCMLSAWAIQREWASLELCAMLVPILSAGCLFTACFYMAWSSAQYRLQISAVTAGTFLVMLLLWKAIQFSEDKIVWDWHLLLPAAAALGAGLLASRPRNHRR